MADTEMYIRVGDFDELQILIFSKNVGYFKRITATYKGIPNFVDVSNNNPVHGLGRRIREPLDYCMWFLYLFVFGPQFRAVRKPSRISDTNIIRKLNFRAIYS